jgi:hypothetical protein
VGNKVFYKAMSAAGLTGTRTRWWYYRIFTWKLRFCPIACSNLIKLLEDEPDLRIVVSSSWRLSSLWFVKNTLRINGIDPRRVIGVTGYEGSDADGENTTRLSGCPRGEQIQRWLYDNTWHDVTSIVIVDDDSDMAHLRNFHVKTSMEEGFMFKKMERVREILAIPYKLGMKHDLENPLT